MHLCGTEHLPERANSTNMFQKSGTGGWFRTNCLVDHNHAL
jgi:hypothetical protein